MSRPGGHQGTRIAAIAAIAAILLGGGVLAVIHSGLGDTDGGMLSAMKRDPMARYRPAGSTLVDTTERAPGHAMATASQGRISRTFTVPVRDAGLLFASAESVAVKAGWKVIARTDGDPLASRSVTARKDVAAVTNFSLNVFLNRRSGQGVLPQRTLALHIELTATPT